MTSEIDSYVSLEKHLNEDLLSYSDMIALLTELEEHDYDFYKVTHREPEPVFQIYSKEFIELLASWLERVDGRIIEIMAGDGRLTKHLNTMLKRKIIATDNKSWNNSIVYPKWVKKIDALDAVKKYNPDAVLLCWEPYGCEIGAKIAHELKKPMMWIGEGQGGCTGAESLFDSKEYVWVKNYDLCIARTDGGFKNVEARYLFGNHTGINLFNWHDEWLIGEEGVTFNRYIGYESNWWT